MGLAKQWSIPSTACRSCLVQEWLGHHSPAFTLATYVHLMDGGLGDADFLDDWVTVIDEEENQRSQTTPRWRWRRRVSGVGRDCDAGRRIRGLSPATSGSGAP